MADDIKGNEAAAQSLEIRTLLKAMMQYGASDLHLSSGSPPQLRVDGRLRQLRADILKPADTKRLCMSILTEKQRRDFEDKNDMDVSFGVEKLARFRANIFRQRGAIAGSFRKIPYEVPKISALGVPDDFVRLVSKPNGLVLVTGPTGAGKSTTLAAAIDKINAERHCHIVTIEDPIEYLHSHKKSLVNQREVGADTDSFRDALKYVLRQDPDVILIGEMRDIETVEAALALSETGHLVWEHSIPTQRCRQFHVSLACSLLTTAHTFAFNLRCSTGSPLSTADPEGWRRDDAGDRTHGV